MESVEDDAASSVLTEVSAPVKEDKGVFPACLLLVLLTENSSGLLPPIPNGDHILSNKQLTFT